MLRNSEPDAIAHLTVAFRAVDNRAGGQLIELFYSESKRLAAGHKGLPRVEELLAGLGNIKPVIRDLVAMKVFAANGRGDRFEVWVPRGGRTPLLEVRPALAADKMGWPASVRPAAG